MSPKAHPQDPRDLAGYGGIPPRTVWPHHASVALSFVLNYEEGAENTVLNGDAHSETYLHELAGGDPVHGGRSLNTESGFAYGARAGVWRILRLFERAELPLTVFAVGRALELNPDVGRAFVAQGHEVASHHWRWIDYAGMLRADEREHILRSIDAITRICGEPPVGWYGGRVSEHSRELAAETGVFRYDSDVYDDDLPHWTRAAGRDVLLLPYALDTNDVKFTVAPGFGTGDDFGAYLRDTLDQLRAEGTAGATKMMSVGLHARVSGRPGRAAALQRFLEYVADCGDVWVARRDAIAELWTQQHPAGVAHGETQTERMSEAGGRG